MNIEKLRKLIFTRHKKIVITQVGSCIECISHYRDADGYTIVGRNRKPVALHRQVYEWVNNCIIDRDVLIRHSCDNPSCINPAHLLPGSHQDNKNDAVSRNRIAIGSKNGNAKLSEADVLKIKTSTISQQKLADIYSVQRETIGHIKRGLSWRGSES